MGVFFIQKTLAIGSTPTARVLTDFIDYSKPSQRKSIGLGFLAVL